MRIIEDDGRTHDIETSDGVRYLPNNERAVDVPPEYRAAALANIAGLLGKMLDSIGATHAIELRATGFTLTADIA